MIREGSHVCIGCYYSSTSKLKFECVDKFAIGSRLLSTEIFVFKLKMLLSTGKGLTIAKAIICKGVERNK